MGAAENKQTIRDAFTAWANGDGTAFFNTLADDVRWTVIGTSPGVPDLYQPSGISGGSGQAAQRQAGRADQPDRGQCASARATA